MDKKTEENQAQTPDNNKKIESFIDQNLIISGFPSSKEIKSGGKYQDCQVVINVSDIFYLGNSEEIMNEGKLNYYFPMGEMGNNMGMNSIFGALQVLHHIYKWNPEWKVLIHCQEGKNRSVTIRDAFHFMMLGYHKNNTTKECNTNNRILYNCNEGCLPEIKKMELFLTKCKYAFDHPERFIGGMFDWVMFESGCFKIKKTIDNNKKINFS